MTSELTLTAASRRAPLPSPMTAGQRRALHELIHAPASARASRWAQPARVGDVAWAAVLALLFAVCVLSPLEDLGYLPTQQSATAVAATRPHVDERVAYAPAPGAGVIR